MSANETIARRQSVQGTLRGLTPPAQKLILCATGFLTWVVLLDFNYRIASTGLDDSWSSGLGFFLAHHFQIGSDYHFTTGPLGYFLTRGFVDDLFWHKLAWELAIKGIFAWTLLQLTRPLGRWWARIPICGVVILFSHQTLTMPDILYFFVLLVHLLMLARTGFTVAHASGSWEQSASMAVGEKFGFAFNILVIAVLALVKNTFLFFSIIGMVLYALQFLWRRQFAKAFFLLAGFGGSLIVLWLALGQNPAHFIAYVRGGFHVASGYAEGMALVGLQTDLIQAGLILMLLAICSATLLASFQHVLRHGTALILIALALFFEWKHGFVRHDHHAFSFFGFTLLVPFVLPALFPEWNWRMPVRRICLASIFVLSAANMELVLKNNHIGYARNPLQLLTETGADVARTITIAADPPDYRRQMQELEEKLAETYSLPQIKARIGDASVDFISYEQGLVLLNRMNWRPRPVFQSCTAYTPYLLAANAEFFRGPRAPDYVILRPEPIDGRLPMMEDGPALLEILRNYRPVLMEKCYLLLQKKQTSPEEEDSPARAVCEKTLHLNEEVVINDPGTLPLVVYLNVQYSTLGKLRRFIYKAPPLTLRVRTAAGQIHSFRFIPDMGRTGFLLHPLLVNEYDVLQFYGSGPANRVASLCIQADPGDPRCYKSAISMKLEARSDLGRGGDAPAIQSMLYPFFRNYPREVRSPVAVQRVPCEGRDGLLIPPDGALVFSVLEGAHWVRAQFGILPGAYQEGQTDGVLFRVEFLPEDEPPQVLFERHLNPVHNPGDRGMQALAVPLPDGRKGSVQFITTNRPGDNGWWDWSFWTGIAID